jgi:hypothetical protein
MRWWKKMIVGGLTKTCYLRIGTNPLLSMSLYWVVLLSLMESSQERLYRGYEHLIRQIPSLKTKLLDQDLLELNSLFRDVNSFPISNAKCALIMIKLRKGSGGARGDDAANLKPVVVGWIPSILGTPVTVPLSPSSKLDRGFEHDDTGCLLCPIEYNWGDAT